VGEADQLRELAGNQGGRFPLDAETLPVRPELVADMGIQRLSAAEDAIGKAQADDRVPRLPVPLVMEEEPLEQGFAAFEQAAQGVHQQALAEAPRPRQEVVLAFLHQAVDVRGLVDVVVAALDDVGEGLDADGQLLAGGGHGDLLGQGVRHRPA
jgi:hypothetical protein